MPDDGAPKVIQVPVKRYDVNLTLDQILTPLSQIATRHADGGAASLTATNLAQQLQQLGDLARQLKEVAGQIDAQDPTVLAPTAAARPSTDIAR